MDSRLQHAGMTLGLEFCQKLRDAGFFAVGTAPGNNAAGDGPVIAGNYVLGKVLGLGRLGGKTRQLLTERLELRNGGLIGRTLFGVTAHAFHGGSNIGHGKNLFS